MTNSESASATVTEVCILSLDHITISTSLYAHICTEIRNKSCVNEIIIEKVLSCQRLVL